jgi:hypothetical protein
VKTLSLVVSAALLSCALAVSAGAAVADHQKSSTQYGVSGGNINDSSRAYCCSGTLGSLVTDGSVKYILSNNHVLGRSDAAVAGEDVSQPGLIDNGCRIPPIVADFKAAPKLGTNVDAAVATLRTGTMNTTGSILEIGGISSSVRSATVGLTVKKSGRTTGLTSGTISSVNTSVKVSYQQSCNAGRKFTVSYTNQVVINSSTFSAGGDSGSLIVTNASCPQPVALLFAGSSTTTIGNPIGEVLSKTATAVGKSLSFVGSCTATSPQALSGTASANSAQLSPLEVDRATYAKRQHARSLMLDDAVQGVGVGVADDNRYEAVIVVYDQQGLAHKPIPSMINGVRTKVIATDQFRAYGWNETKGQSCHK